MTNSLDHRRDLTVVGIDGSTAARHALRWAATDAVGRATSLVLVHAGIDPDITRAGAAKAALAAARVIALSIVGDSSHVETVLDPRAPHEVLNGYADTARMLVLGSRRKGAVARAVLGSVSTDVATHARCPIAVVPRGFTRTAIESDNAPVVVGVDCSPNDDAVLDIAFDQASHLGVPLLVVHAYESLQPHSRDELSRHIELGPRLPARSAPQRWIDRLIEPWAEKYPDVEVTAHAVREQPSRALLLDAPQAQLVIVGARSRGAISPLFGGSTSRAVLHRAEVPVIIVPACDGKMR
ncbi:MAG: universal stress protein [Rhodococcus sp. (in: high G+C Gram-positive bacteria)]